MFSKPTEYAIKAVVYIAQQTLNGELIGVKQIAKGINAPEHFIAKILQQLSKSKVINSAKGPKGGFWITEKQATAPILMVVNTIDGEETFTRCVLGLENCSQTNPCPMHADYVKIRTSILNMLEDNTIQSFSMLIDTKIAFLKQK